MKSTAERGPVVLCRSIDFDNDVRVDGQLAREATLGTVFKSEDGRNLLIPSRDLNADHLREISDRIGAHRLNIYTGRILDEAQHIDLISPRWTAWYVVFPSSQFREMHPRVPNIKSAGFSIVRLPHTQITSEQRSQLCRAWERDYVDAFFREANRAVRERQMESFLERLNEGTHMLHLDGEVVVGHGCWMGGDLQAVTLTRSLYWHQWVSPQVSKDSRSRFHREFFHALASQPEPPITGVYYRNTRSLLHCERNGLRPLVLSLRKNIDSGE